MYSKSSILARPGWSALNFDLLLGEPDDIRPNYASSSPMRFYKAERVLAAEAAPIFQQVMQGYRVKIFEVMRTHILPGDRFAQKLREMKIEVVLFTLGRVRQGAIGHYNALRTSEFATRTSSPFILARIMVSYARDVLTIYDHKFEEELKACGAEIALRAIRYTIYRAIGDTYPELYHECMKQYENSPI